MVGKGLWKKDGAQLTTLGWLESDESFEGRYREWEEKEEQRSKGKGKGKGKENPYPFRYFHFMHYNETLKPSESPSFHEQRLPHAIDFGLWVSNRYDACFPNSKGNPHSGWIYKLHHTAENLQKLQIEIKSQFKILKKKNKHLTKLSKSQVNDIKSKYKKYNAKKPSFKNTSKMSGWKNYAVPTVAINLYDKAEMMKQFSLFEQDVDSVWWSKEIKESHYCFDLVPPASSVPRKWKSVKKQPKYKVGIPKYLKKNKAFKQIWDSRDKKQTEMFEETKKEDESSGDDPEILLSESNQKKKQKKQHKSKKIKKEKSKSSLGVKKPKENPGRDAFIKFISKSGKYI